jgi:hypothetical protein
MPDDAWFAIGFGSSMRNIDMIGWFSDNGVGSVKDYWSIDKFTPTEDSISNISQDSAPSFDAATGRMTFVTRRALDTGDSSQDYLIPVGTTNGVSMVYAYHKDSPIW